MPCRPLSYRVVMPVLLLCTFRGGIQAEGVGPGRPAAPTNLEAHPAAPSCIVLSWNDNSDNESGFRVERKVTGPWKFIGAVPAGATRFESTGMLGGTGRAYRHRVCAMNKAGQSDWVTVGPTSTPDPADGPRGKVIVEATPEFPRNGEGSFLKLKSGELVYFYGAWPSTSDAAKETCIARIVSSDGGDSWSPPAIVLKQSGQDLYHPGAVRMANGAIGLAYTRRISGTRQAEKVFRYSGDEGATWSDEIPISDGNWQYYITGAHDRLVRLSNDRLLVPVFMAELNSAVVIDGKPVAAALVFASDDNGLTWKRKTPSPLSIGDDAGERSCEEPGIVEHAPGKLLLVCRTGRGWLYESRSEDFGETWSEPARSSVLNPRAPARLEKVPGSEAILMIHNSHVSGQKWHRGARVMLASQISRDGGRTWQGYREIEYHGQATWYDYPSVYWTGDQLHVAYRAIAQGAPGWKRVDVRYQRLDKEWLTGE